MEIVPGVYSVPVATPTFMGVYDPNVYLVKGERAVLVDSGYGDSAAVGARLDYLKKTDTALEYIILTHCHPDHIGGAGGLKAATGAKVLTHYLETTGGENESSFSPGVDKGVKDGETIGLGGIELEVVHTPGHSPGHICLYMRQGKVLFSGDHILGIGTTAISPRSGDMAQYIDSLRKLLRYDLSCICPGHGPVIREPRRKIQELVQHRLEREEQVLSCLRRGKCTVPEMVEEIYPELDSRLYGMASDQVWAHLVKLDREGIIVLRQIEGNPLFALVS